MHFWSIFAYAGKKTENNLDSPFVSLQEMLHFFLISKIKSDLNIFFRAQLVYSIFAAKAPHTPLHSLVIIFLFAYTFHLALKNSFFSSQHLHTMLHTNALYAMILYCFRAQFDLHTQHETIKN